MTCCVIALALAMQVIESWRRLKSWFGIVPRESTAEYGLGTVVAGLLERLRSPALKYVVLTLLALEGAWAGGWLYAHRAHLGNEIAALIYAGTGYGSALCNGDTATASGTW